MSIVFSSKTNTSHRHNTMSCPVVFVSTMPNYHFPNQLTRIFKKTANEPVFYAFKEIIEERLLYLDKNLDEDQNINVYTKTKNLLIETLKHMCFSKYPFIGVDDNGQSIAEWHNYEDKYEILIVIPVSEDKIIFKALNKDRTVTLSKTLVEVKTIRSRILHEFTE